MSRAFWIHLRESMDKKQWFYDLYLTAERYKARVPTECVNASLFDRLSGLWLHRNSRLTHVRLVKEKDWKARGDEIKRLKEEIRARDFLDGKES